MHGGVVLVKKVFKIIGNIVFAVFIVVCIAIVAQSFMSKAEGKTGGSFFGLRNYVVLTGSMSPTFNAGALIWVMDTPLEEFKIGDIVSYYVSDDKETVLTHRVVRITENGELITRGDTNNVDDARPVTKDKVIGKAVFWMNGAGYVIDKLQDTKLLITFIAVVVFAFFLPDVIRFIKKKKSKDVTAEATESAADVKEDNSNSDDSDKNQDEATH